MYRQHAAGQYAQPLRVPGFAYPGTMCALTLASCWVACRAAELDAKQKLKREAAEREMERWKQMQHAADKENSHLQVQIDKLDDEARMIEKRMVELATQEQQVHAPRAHASRIVCIVIKSSKSINICLCMAFVPYCGNLRCLSEKLCECLPPFKLVELATQCLPVA
jgi:hypothetical protein